MKTLKFLVEGHKIVNPLTYEDPKEATESNHFRLYAFVKCVNGIKGRLLLKAGEDGIMFKDSILRLAISKRVPIQTILVMKLLQIIRKISPAAYILWQLQVPIFRILSLN